MTHDRQTNVEILGPNLDPRWLALFMICVTQDGYISTLLPEDGSEPDYANTPFSKLGLGTDVQKQFFALFGAGSKTGANRQKFVDVVHLFKQLSLYHPPACPDAATLEAVVDMLSSLRIVVDNALERFGVE